MARVGNTSGTATSHTTLVWVTYFLDLLAWIVLLAGISSLQRTDYVNRGGTVSDVYSFQWWVVVFQFITLVGVFYACAAGHHEIGRVAMIAFLAISTVLLFGETNTFYGNYRRGVEPHRRVTTYFVGALLSSIFNLLLIIYLGNTAMEIVSPFRRGGVVHKHGATTGTTGAATV
ncbi:g4077 [Coccomyxa elongata]